MKEKDVLNQIEEAHKSVTKLKDDLVKTYSKTYSNIVFSGIGKSGLVERVIRDLNINIPVETSIDSVLPDLNSKSLAIVISYSGITKDIIDFYNFAQKKTKKIIVISSNKSFLKNAKTKGFLTVELNNSFDSANSFFLVLYSTILILKKIKLLKITESQYEESISKISNFSKNFKSFQLAELLKDKIPLIYVWDEYSCLGYLIMNSFNLHAKHFCLRSSIPEASYNDVEALAYGDSKVLPIFLIPPNEKAKKIMGSMKEISKNAEVFDVPKGIKLTQIVYTYMFFELVAQRLANLKGVDSKSRKFVEQLKEKIRSYD